MFSLLSNFLRNKWYNCKTEVKNEVNFFQFQKTKIPMIWKMTNWNIQISIALKKDDYSNNLNKIVYILLVRIKALNF